MVNIRIKNKRTLKKTYKKHYRLFQGDPYTVKKNSETLPPKNGQQRKFQIAETFPHIWGKIFSNLTGLTV